MDDPLQMETVIAHCSRKTTLETDPFPGRSNSTYKNCKSIAQKLMSTLKVLSLINAAKSNHDTKETIRPTHTTYSVETLEPPVDSPDVMKVLRDKLIQLKDGVIKKFEDIKGYFLTRIESDDKRATRPEERAESSNFDDFRKEADWFRTEFDKRVGRAPALTSEEAVIQKLRDQASTRRRGAVRYYRHVPQPKPISVTSLAWPHPRGVIKCMCPSKTCVCSKNKLKKRQKLPGSEWLWLRFFLSKPYSRKQPPAEEMLPKLLEPVYAEMERDKERDDEPKSTDPYLCFEGCHNFYYYDRSNADTVESSSVEKKKEVQDVYTVYSDQWIPKPQPDTGQKEILVESDPVSTNYDKVSVSSQIERNEKIVEAQSSISKYGHPKSKTTVLKDWCGVELNVTLLSDVYDKLAASTSNTRPDPSEFNCSFKSFMSITTIKKYYDKLKKSHCSSTGLSEPNDTIMQTDVIQLSDISTAVCNLNTNREIATCISLDGPVRKETSQSRNLLLRLQRIIHWDPGKHQGIKVDKVLKRLHLSKRPWIKRTQCSSSG